MMQMESTNFQIGGRELQNIAASNRVNGNNYFKWSQIINTFLKGKGKQSHILGIGLKEGYARLSTCDEEGSMIPKISDIYVSFTTANHIWDALKQT